MLNKTARALSIGVLSAILPGCMYLNDQDAAKASAKAASERPPSCLVAASNWRVLVVDPSTDAIYLHQQEEETAASQPVEHGDEGIGRPSFKLLGNVPVEHRARLERITL